MAGTQRSVRLDFIAKTKPAEVGLKNLQRAMKDFNTAASRAGVSGQKLAAQVNRIGAVAGRKNVQEMAQATRRLEKDMTRMQARIGEVRQEFQMWALGVMFFGMQIQRTFIGILRTGANTFTKLIESSGYFGTNIQQLSAHWEYLKFTIGHAIETALGPLMPTIIDVVNKMADWIQRNQSLAAWIAIVGAALGTAMLLIGQFTLGLSGLHGMFLKIGGALGVAGGGTGILGALTAFLALLAAPIIFTDLLLEIDEFGNVWNDWFGDDGTLKSAFDDLFGEDGSLRGIVSAFFEFFSGWISGDEGKVKNALAKLKHNLVLALGSMMVVVTLAVADLIRITINYAVKKAIEGIEDVVKGFLIIVDEIHKFLGIEGVDWGEIDRGFEKMYDAMKIKRGPTGYDELMMPFRELAWKIAPYEIPPTPNPYYQGYSHAGQEDYQDAFGNQMSGGMRVDTINISYYGDNFNDMVDKLGAAIYQKYGNPYGV